nr:FAD-dependent oxidoreductase [uncultured Holophaga sp.]
MSTHRSIEEQSTDVLVIGGGIAGLAAALAAKERHPDLEVLVVDKCTTGWGGKANKGGGNLAFLAPGDDVEAFMRFRLEEIGCGLEDPQTLRDFITSAHDILQRLESWGVQVFHQPDGSYTHVRWIEGMPWRMALCEQDITERMAERARRLGVRILDHVALVDLLKDGSRVCGAFGFSLLDTTEHLIRAGAVVLANGNQNYRLMRRWSSARGDGIAAAWRAGAAMRNAEFGSYSAWVFADTKEVCQGAEDVLTNALGENISRRVRPVMEADGHSKEIVAWWREMQAGRGPLRANMAENRIAELSARAFHSDGVALRPLTTAFWTRTIQKAMAATKHPGPLQEVHPGFIGELSPVAVDPGMATTVPGLFAAGDICACASGWAGAVPAPPGRLRGSGMMNALWSGIRAGEGAAAHTTPLAPLDEGQLDGIRQRVFAPLAGGEGLEAMDLVREVQALVAPVGSSICKRADRLERALQRLEGIRARLPLLRARDGHHLSACNEAGAMVLGAELFFRASLARRESRGWHLREDYPEQDDRGFRHWIVLREVEGALQISAEAVGRAGLPA